MKLPFKRALISGLTCFAGAAHAQLPPPPNDLHDWPMPWGENVPGAISAKSLLRAPAGGDGFVIARDGHFYTGDRRIRFWGVNTCFGGNFPTHEQADEIANRLANFGVNCVRFHHMDMFAYPAGIFADASMRKLHPEALDRLDYFIAALKKQGIYSNLNLHVSRSIARADKWPEADKLPGMDKIVDLFHPELIAAQKDYARDLLTHVNPYTKTAYATEPAIAMVEINNENTLFIWGAGRTIAGLPEPYQAVLRKQWNDWLAKRYGSDEKLKAAWSAGAAPVGEDVLAGKWVVEAHAPAQMTHIQRGTSHVLEVIKVSDTNWHLQFQEQGLKIEQDAAYTLAFEARADRSRRMDVNIGQAHAPWQILGFAERLKLTNEPQSFKFTFRSSAEDANARLTFVLGDAVGTVTLENVRLRKGGIEAFADGEALEKGSIDIGRPDHLTTKPRQADWTRFLQETDEAYFVGMQKFLKEDLGVRAPITGSIGWSIAGTHTQSKLDFVDGHAYWDHPTFPGKDWDPTNWLIHNRPMVDRPEAAALWGLAATRVEGKPYTVTEYNHSAPNEWAAESIPMIAAYAAAQDWDGVFLFAYTHNSNFRKDRIESFFDIEGDPTKMAQMPQGARIFLGGGVQSLDNAKTVSYSPEKLAGQLLSADHDAWQTLRNSHDLKWESLLQSRFALNFGTPSTGRAPSKNPLKLHWSSSGKPGTGLFTMDDPRGVAFVGFRPIQPVQLGVVEISDLRSPFAAVMVLPADPSETLATSKRLLVSAVGRTTNRGMGWNAARTTVSDKWGKGPVQIETVSIRLKIDGSWRIHALKPDGSRGYELTWTQVGGKTIVDLGVDNTVWHELIRK